MTRWFDTRRYPQPDLIWAWNGVDTSEFTVLKGSNVETSSGVSVYSGANAPDGNWLEVSAVRKNPTSGITTANASCALQINGSWPDNYMVVCDVIRATVSTKLGLAWVGVNVASLSAGAITARINPTTTSDQGYLLAATETSVSNGSQLSSGHSSISSYRLAMAVWSGTSGRYAVQVPSMQHIFGGAGVPSGGKPAIGVHANATAGSHVDGDTSRCYLRPYVYALSAPFFR